MYIAYGWPQVIPLNPGLLPPSSTSSDGIVYLRISGCLLLVVGPTHLELWSITQHKLRLGMYERDSDSVSREGENVSAVWSPDSRYVAVLTSMGFIHVFKVQVSGKKVVVGGKHSRGISLANISLFITEKVPFSDANPVTSNLVCDNKYILYGHVNGHLALLSWTGEFRDPFEIRLDSQSSDDTATLGRDSRFLEPTHGSVNSSSIVQLELSMLLKLLVVLYSDGRVTLCSIGKKGLRQSDSIKAGRWLNVGDAVCSSIASDQQFLAIGCRRGVVELYDLTDGATHLRTLSLYDWGYSAEDTGPVSCIAWTPDNSAFAVGWKYRGLTVWSVSGCRLMCTIRQIGMNSASSPMVKPNHDFKYEPLVGGASHLQWDEYGYKLHIVEERSIERIIAFPFGKCCSYRGLSGTSFVRQVIYGDDRVLIVQAGDSDELKITHVNLPVTLLTHNAPSKFFMPLKYLTILFHLQVSYISQNWPVLYVAASKDGMYLAVAGRHGLILYDLRSKRWRLFGDITQEQKIECKGLLWLGKIVVVCNYVESSNL